MMARTLRTALLAAPDSRSMAKCKGSALPLPECRGLSRAQAAAYVGVTLSMFDRMVAASAMPGARRFEERRIWDRHELDAAFSLLPTEEPQAEAQSPYRL